MEGEEVGRSKEQYIMMKKHESREEGSPLDVTATRGANGWELWYTQTLGLQGQYAVLEPHPYRPQLLRTVCMTCPAGVQAFRC